MAATTLFARQIGAAAREALCDPDRSWSVLASVRGAIYAESDAGDILWIATDPTALHARGILVPSLPTNLPEAGSSCSVGGGCLRVGEKLTVRIRDARVWHPEPLRQERSLPPGAAQRAADAIAGIAAGSPVRGTLARITFPPADDDATSPREALGADAIDAAKRGIASLCRISQGLALPQCLHEVSGLVGLGGGLTPSGDDLLGGFLFTLRTLDSALRNELGVDWRRVEAWLQCIRARTNRISFAILAGHAHGEAAEPLHAFVRAISEGKSEERLAELGERVARIGHSSGWDLLSGVHCACLAIARTLSTSRQTTCGAD